MSFSLEHSSDYTLAVQEFSLGLVAGSCGVICAGIEASSYLVQFIGAVGCSISIPNALKYPIDQQVDNVSRQVIPFRLIGGSPSPVQSLVERIVLVFASYGIFRIGTDIQALIRPLRIALLEGSTYRFRSAYNHL